MSEIKLTKMRRDEPTKPGGPVTADVHPAEVEAFKAAGWRVDDAPAKEAAAPVADDAPKPERKPRGK